MSATQLPRAIEEIARLGTEILDRQIQPLLRPEDDGKFVAIDVNSGEHEIDADDYSAVARLRARVPSADMWLARAGYPTAYQIR